MIPLETYPNSVAVGSNINAPQTTEQRKYQFRDDFSWRKSGWGVGHDFKAGANFIHEQRLFITFNSGAGIPQFTHNTNDRNGAISTVTLSGGANHADMPLKQFATYIQDDWRLTNRVTLNLGLRYDLMTGYQIDQSKDPNFVALQAAGQSGRLNGLIGFEDFGKEPKEDHNNVQPRLGMAWDVRGNGRDVVRAGWGIYTDVGYTNSNILFGALDATGLGFGPVFTATDPNGLRNPDGTLFRPSDPLSNLANLNEVRAGSFPLYGFGPISPRLEQPESWQTAVGWTHQLGDSTVFNVDVVHIDGKKLNIRPRLNTRPNGGPRRLADLALSPNNLNLRPAISSGKSQYDGLILSLRRRMANGLDFSGSYTLSESKSNIGASSDALDASLIQDALNPFDDPRVFGPNNLTDARHRFSLSAIWQAPLGLQIAPIYIFRSALPVSTTQGLDLNNDFTNNEIPDKAFEYNPDDPAHPKELGGCETWNCSRGYRFQQLNLRVSRAFRLRGAARVEAIGEVFNLFNTENPGDFVTRRFTGSIASPVPNATFMQPTSFAGDFRKPEQRVGQIGLRFSF